MSYEIFNENCLEGMKGLADDLVDLTVTSPPYDNLRTYNGHVKDFRFEPLAQELWRVTKRGGIVVWIVNDATINGSETGTSFRQALYFKDLGFNLHDTMIWQRAGCTAPESNRYYPNFEYMFVLSKGAPKTVHLLKDRKNLSAGSKKSEHATLRLADGTFRKPSKNWIGVETSEYGVRFNIWRQPQYTARGKVHPATFPLKLVEDHIKSWSNAGDTILDPLAGSGTTAVACVNLARNFIGFEISAEYYDIARERIDKAIALKEQSLF